jgi:predicted amidohydrolase YtcJ
MFKAEDPFGIRVESTIFFGGPILTINDEQPKVEAMAIRDGRILAVGSRDDVFRHHTSRTRIVDLEGRALMPGFIDPHVHLGWSAFTRYCWLQVGPPTVNSRGELIETLRAAAATTRAGEWITACGYEPDGPSFERDGGRTLNAADLDQASLENPILVMQKYGDVFYVNHRAVEVARIDTRSAADTSVRDSEGNLTGRFRGSDAFSLFSRTFPTTSLEKRVEYCKGILREWTRRGCTTVYETALGGLWGEEEVRLFLEIASDPSTQMRLRTALVTDNDLPHVAGIRPNQGNDRLRFLGIKFWADPKSRRRAALINGRLPSSFESGHLNETDDDLRLRMKARHDSGWQLVIRANSHDAIEETLSAFDAILSASPRQNHRHRIEGCSRITEPQLRKARTLGLSVSHLVDDIYRGGRGRNSSRECECSVNPVASGLANGVFVSLHSDSPTTPVDPLRYVQTAVTRMTLDGEVIGPDQRVTVDQALKTITRYAAHQCFLDDVVGSLEPGKIADLVVLEQDPRTVDPAKIAQIGVLETYIAGVEQGWR